MKNESELIKILCYKLSGDVSRAVYNEYENRWGEIQRIWQYPNSKYKFLEDYPSTVKHLLSISTFYRRVLSGINGACDFFKTVTKAGTKEQSIDIGSYRLDKGEYNKMLAIQITFRKLREKYGIDEHFFDYCETEDFLERCRDLYLSHVNATPGTSSATSEEDIPF